MTTKRLTQAERLMKKKKQLDAEFMKPELDLHSIEHLARDLHAAACAAKQTKTK